MATEAMALEQRLNDAAELKPEQPHPLFRDLPNPTPFPIAALGATLSLAAKAIRALVQCPIECAANSVLAVASLAAQGRANVMLPVGNGKATPLSLFILSVLESGERKSTADGYALYPVREFERELKEQEAEAQNEYRVRFDAWDTAAAKIKKLGKGDRAKMEAELRALGPAPLLPLQPIVAPSSDPTIEGMFRVFQHGRPALGILCDDAATFLGGHSMKAEQKAGATGALCRAWDGSRLERIRGGDGSIVLYDRRLAVHLMVQPGVAAGFLSDPVFADQGLLARFLISAPAPLAGTRFRDPEQDGEIARTGMEWLQPYNKAITRLLRHPIRWKNENDRLSSP